MKLKQFQSYLKKNKIDLAFLVTPDINVTYFTQMKPSHSHLTITSKTANLYLTKLDKHPKLKDITIKNLSKDWKKKLANKKAKTIGINKEVLTVAHLDKLKKVFPNASFVDISKQLKELRLQKTPEEVKMISKACDITSRAFNDLINELKNKVLQTEKDVAFYLEKRMKQLGAEGSSFPTIVAMGKNAAVPHHQTSNQRLHKGFLLIDFGACYNNYCADMTRMVYLGTPTKNERELYRLLLTAQENAICFASRGSSFIDLTKETKNKLGKHATKFIHSLGHGIGLEIHESPAFSDKSQKVITNVTFTIEPGLYFPNKLGLRIEDTVIFSGKTKILTKASKELVCVKIRSIKQKYTK